VLQQNVNSLHVHNKVDFDKSKRVCYLFASFMPISKAFCIAALLAVHIYLAQEMKIVKYIKVNEY
jgi:hypothetical protein